MIEIKKGREFQMQQKKACESLSHILNPRRKILIAPKWKQRYLETQDRIIKSIFNDN